MGWFDLKSTMKKIKIGIFGPNGRMGRDIIERVKLFNLMEISTLCEKKKTQNSGHRNW